MDLMNCVGGFLMMIPGSSGGRENRKIIEADLRTAQIHHYEMRQHAEARFLKKIWKECCAYSWYLLYWTPIVILTRPV